MPVTTAQLAMQRAWVDKSTVAGIIILISLVLLGQGLFPLID
jgi:hypothetical protein